MEDPKFKGNEMKAVYEQQEPLPPPKLLYHESRVTGERYNDDGSLWVSPEEKLAAAKAKAAEIKKEDATKPKPDAK